MPTMSTFVGLPYAHCNIAPFLSSTSLSQVPTDYMYLYNELSSLYGSQRIWRSEAAQRYSFGYADQD